MRQKRLLAWLGATAAMAVAVVALRGTQPPAGPGPDRATPPPTRPVTIARYAAEGVLLPEVTPRPAAVPAVLTTRTGPGRLRVAWADALPGGTRPAGVVGYHVRWRVAPDSSAGSGRSTVLSDDRFVVAPETELDGLPAGAPVTVDVRAVDAYGQRSAPTAAIAAPDRDGAPDPARFTGLVEEFDGPFSVDDAVLGARWHLSGQPGCTGARTARGMLDIDLACGTGLAVLRARAPLRLTDPGTAGERGRVLVVTDGGGPRGSLTVDLVPGPVDRVGIQDSGAADTAVASGTVDTALPDGTVRVVVDDAGARVLVGPGVPRLAAPLTPAPAPARGVGVLHTVEVVLDGDGVRVLQDGAPVAAAGVAPTWTEATVLIGVGGPPGQQARVRLDTVGLTGPAVPPPATYTHPVVLATQRVLGTGELAPGIGISRERLTGAASARLVAGVRTTPGVDLGGLTLQQGDAVVPARPVLGATPSRPYAEITVVAELLPQLLDTEGPPAISPLVLRAPGADAAVLPIGESYLEITPRDPDNGPTRGADSRGRQIRRPDTALPRPVISVLDNDSRAVTTVAAGSRLILDVSLDGLGGQLGALRLAGLAGFQLWLGGRQIAGVPTAVDGPGIGGTYRVALSTRALPPGRQSIELRLISADPAISPASVLTTWHLG